MSGGELCLLQKEVDDIVLMRDKIMSNDICRDLIVEKQNEYEKPQITELFNNMFKGKADIINHNEKLIIDLKTTLQKYYHSIGDKKNEKPITFKLINYKKWVINI